MPFRKSKPWGNTQPSVGAVLDYGSPLAVGLKACVLFNEGAGARLTNLCSPNRLAITGAVPWVPGQAGKAVKFNVASAAYYSDAAFNWAASSDITVSLRCFVAAGSSQNTAFTLGNSATAPNRVDAYIPYVDNNLYWDYSDATTGRIFVSFTPYLSQWVEVTLVGGISFRAIYVNGKLLASATAAGTGNGALTGLWLGQWTSNYYDGAMSHFYLWNRRLVQSEIFKVVAEPYAMIVPPRRRISSQQAATDQVYSPYFLNTCGKMMGY